MRGSVARIERGSVGAPGSGGIDVLAPDVAKVERGLRERLRRRTEPLAWQPADWQRASATVIRPLAKVEVVLQSDEGRQHLLPAPTQAAVGHPTRIVVWYTAHGAGGIDG